jgi:hypothetical protein
MQSCVFYVERLVFEGTELGLKRQLERQTGVVSVEIDPVAHRVTVHHDERIASRAGVRRAIADCGYWSPECDGTVEDRDALSRA